MDDLIFAEIETLQMLAGQLPLVWSVTVAICLEELSRRGLCTSDIPPKITSEGVDALEKVTGTLDWRSRARKYLASTLWRAH